MRKLITNARIISPGIDLPNAAVLIKDDRIVSVIEGNNLPTADYKVDAAGKMLMPGFIDIHSHGADGHDVCDDSIDSLRHIARRKLQEGVTTWLPTTLTQPREKLKSIAGKIAAFRNQGGLTRCPGMHVEGPFINKERAGAQNPQFVRLPDFAEVEELHSIMPALILGACTHKQEASMKFFGGSSVRQSQQIGFDGDEILEGVGGKGENIRRK